MKCEWCNGSGRQYVESESSLCYCCPDCNGSGKEQPEEEECKICGEWKEVEEDCEWCEEMKEVSYEDNNKREASPLHKAGRDTGNHTLNSSGVCLPQQE
jgi:DnaJ-class molecular chaperone